MQTVDKDRREALRPLFAGFPGLHGAIDSVLEGVLGQAFVDDPNEPGVARLAFDDFHCVAGDPDRRGAAETLMAIRAGDHVTIAESWKSRLVKTRDAAPYDRFAFSSPDRWDRDKLAALQEGLPDRYMLEWVTVETVAAFEELNDTFVNNFRSTADFLERGVGFGIREQGASEFVAGCASYTVSSRSLEFEIETHADYQRRGLALVTGARMIEHCLDNGLEPCWDAAHVGSALLAERLGFVGRRRYTAYRV